MANLRFGWISTVCLLASACASNEVSVSGYAPPKNAAEAKAEAAEGAALELAQSAQPAAGAGASRTDRFATPVPGAAAAPPAPAQPGPEPAPQLPRPTRISFESAPIPAFINAVFAETLKFSVRIDPAVSARAETITLRTGDPVAGPDLFNIAAAALRDYGVEVVVESPRTLRFTTVDRQRGGAPQVFRGGSISRDAATGDGAIYYYYQIRAANSNTLFTIISNAFGGRLTVTASPQDNALMLTGPSSLIEAAVDMLETFDQPRMAGKPAVAIEPVFFTPTRMADALSRVLRTAGYAVSTTPDAAAINILPLDEVGILLIFAADDQVRDFAADWARQMDEPRQAGGDNQAFIYFVKNTDADSVAKVLGSALSDTPPARPNSAASLAGDARQPAAPSQPAGSAGGQPQVMQAAGLRIATDPARNALIFVGRAEQYSSILPLLRQLDRSPGEVLIEVVLAEVTVTDRTSLGVEFDLGTRLSSGDVPIRGGTQGLGVGSSGLTLRLLDPASNARVLINTLASRNRVNILSNPRVVAKSGSDAKIQVGTQVPVLRQQSSRPDLGQNGVTNTVDYIDTGVVLSVRPVIRGDRRVSLEVSQEVSEAQQNDTSEINSPLIFTRSIATSLSLEDGQTVLLGGLKSQNRSNTRNGIPGVSRLPAVGALFRNEAAGRTETELLVFITPYVVTDPTVAAAVADRYRETMRRWPNVTGGLQW